MAKDTKERILALALDKFSQNGYDGTNIRELTSSLGLVKSALYRHFDSKEAIWNALLDEMIAYYEAGFGSSEHLPPVPDSLEGLVTLTMGMADFTIHDEGGQDPQAFVHRAVSGRAGPGPGHQALPHGPDGHVHPPLSGHDGQGSPPSRRPRYAGLCLYRPHLRPHPPVRPGAGEDG